MRRMKHVPIIILMLLIVCISYAQEIQSVDSANLSDAILITESNEVEMLPNDSSQMPLLSNIHYSGEVFRNIDYEYELANRARILKSTGYMLMIGGTALTYVAIYAVGYFLAAAIDMPLWGAIMTPIIAAMVGAGAAVPVFFWGRNIYRKGNMLQSTAAYFPVNDKLSVGAVRYANSLDAYDNALGVGVKLKL